MYYLRQACVIVSMKCNAIYENEKAGRGWECGRAEKNWQISIYVMLYSADMEEETMYSIDQMKQWWVEDICMRWKWVKMPENLLIIWVEKEQYHN